MGSRWVGLPQARGMTVSEFVALCPPPPGVVVTYFVTGSRIISSIRHVHASADLDGLSARHSTKIAK
jgi:hypothetical protein